MLTRPRPPEEVLDPFGKRTFIPAPELEAWSRALFIDEGAPLVNDEHVHLRVATIGMVWAGIGNARMGRRVVGQCEPGTPRAMGRWAKHRAEQQLIEWFGTVPDFLITIDAHYAAECEDTAFMALMEHELSHAGQEHDEFGSPKFSKTTGRPIFGMRDHDVTEFVHVVQRYGATSPEVRAMAEAVMAGPSISPVNIARACGTCLARAA